MKLDAQLAFYLKHQEHIDEWARLRERLPAEAHRFFSGLASDLANLAEKLGDDVETFIDLKSDHPKLFLYRDAWRLDRSALPRVAIGLEWVRKTAHFARAYSGVWVDRSADDGGQLEQSLRSVLLDAARASDSTSRNWWPVLRVEQPSSAAWWDELLSWRAALHERLRQRWDTLANEVDRVLATHDTQVQAEADFVAALVDEFERLAHALGPDVQVHRRLGVDWPGLRLYRTAWRNIGASIGIEWQPGGCSSAPMTFGLALDSNMPGFERAYAAIGEQAPSRYLAAPWRKTNGWPIAGQLAPAGDRSSRTQHILATVRTLWSDLNSVVQRLAGELEVRP